MQRVHSLRGVSTGIGINYWTLRRWCRTDRIEYSRTPTGVICLTDSQVDKLLRQMEANGNAGARAAAASQR
jgi:predicted site-specific integrase-resolvase